MKRRSVQHDPIETMEQERGIVIKSPVSFMDIANAQPVACMESGESSQ
jgi:hypothetical protein